MRPIMNIIFLLLNVFFFATNSFQTNLFKIVNKEYIKENIIISPLSAYQVLGLAANSADGETLDEMIKVLENVNIEEVNDINGEIARERKKFSSIEIANAVMPKQEPKKAFFILAILYEDTVEKLENVAQVNNWCNNKTHGNLRTILGSYDSKTVMLLLNAIYFKGIWKIKFDEKKAKSEIFYNLEKGKIKEKEVEFMGVESKFLYYKDKTTQIIELPYEKDNMSAIIVLPNEEININDYISNLTDDKLPKLINNMETKKIQLELPKFKIHFSTNLAPALIKMGMNIPFSKGADFSKLVDNAKDIYINDIIQNIFLSVDEKGSEDAAITDSKIIEKNVSMVVNRPFLFMLRNKKYPKNYQILFMAKIEKIDSTFDFE